MAQAQIERIADYLNEAKRSAEQLLIVQHLSKKIFKIPFKLTDTNEVLLRQDSIQWVVGWCLKEAESVCLCSALMCRVKNLMVLTESNDGRYCSLTTFLYAVQAKSESEVATGKYSKKVEKIVACFFYSFCSWITSHFSDSVLLIFYSRDGAILMFKWYCPISLLQMIEPDYAKEHRLSSYISSLDQGVSHQLFCVA